jgi:nitroimidazol reductase NimA-like FMN-containing flavoprotein (pyridoxamine 5'-phosphate oxidase superfamily)
VFLSMSKSERETFLSETRVGVLSIADHGRGPLTMPVWHHYQPGGDVDFVISSASAKMRLLRDARRASFCVQDYSIPYKYVMVEGPISISEMNFQRDERPMALRYLGAEMGERYLAATEAERAATPNVLIALTPHRWITVDYSKMSF